MLANWTIAECDTFIPAFGNKDVSAMNLLLLSSSTAGNGGYLQAALPLLQQQLSDKKRIVFIPFAGVSLSYDAYINKVNQSLAAAGLSCQSIHQSTNFLAALEDADAIVVGGGNTFALLDQLYQHNLLGVIQQKVAAGCSYTGWSAGSNIAGLTIRTTNDMPIVEPPSLTALGLLNCQLNPHYRNENIAGFHGETRDMRLAEFMQLNPSTPVLALPEGSALRQCGEHLLYLPAAASEPAYLFQAGQKTELPVQVALPYCQKTLSLPD